MYGTWIAGSAQTGAQGYFRGLQYAGGKCLYVYGGGHSCIDFFPACQGALVYESNRSLYFVNLCNSPIPFCQYRAVTCAKRCHRQPSGQTLPTGEHNTFCRHCIDTISDILDISSKMGQRECYAAAREAVPIPDKICGGDYSCIYFCMCDYLQHDGNISGQYQDGRMGLVSAGCKYNYYALLFLYVLAAVQRSIPGRVGKQDKRRNENTAASV